jgi:hypothetical protein
MIPQEAAAATNLNQLAIFAKKTGKFDENGDLVEKPQITYY